MTITTKGKHVPPKVYPGYAGCEGCGKVYWCSDATDLWCKPCRAERGLPEQTTGKYIPWYEKLTPEEMAVVRAARWRPKKPTDWNGRARMPYETGTVIKVAYQRADGPGKLPLMVGKIIPHLSHGKIFFHAFEQTGEGTQSHQNTNCPCPVDTLLIEYLVEHKIPYFYAYDRDAETLWKAPVEKFADAPVAEFAARTVRRRYFLDEGEWEHITRVLEQRRGRVTWLQQGSRKVLNIPFIPANQTIVLETAGGF